MEKHEYYDLHTHFLPGMDLGCKTVDDAVQMVKMMVDQGCMGAVLTPHYYADELVESYLNRRDTAFLKLREALAGTEYEDFLHTLVMGTEVGYHRSLLFQRDLPELCMGMSDYILLELPFSKWTPDIIENVEQLMRTRKVKIIIAHLERYFEYGNKKLINELLKMNVMIQMNTEHLLKFGAFRHALDMIQNKRVDILCTDCHGTFFYPPNMEQALSKMEKHGLQDDIQRMLENNFVIYSECVRARR